ncbi:MAG: SDR family oxidoreductase [Sphingomonadales bacterium]|nr:SDR family oxidoreductase [Sphingomonadales bacterium]
MLTGKRVLLTGGSKGIGAAIARRVLEDGASLVASYNSGIGALAGLSDEFGAKRCHAVRADLGRVEDVDALWQAATGHLGGVDALVNNAAVMLSARPEEDLAAWRADWVTTFAVNVQAVADLCRAAILSFKEAGGGTIVNISSRAAFRGDLPDSFHYAASKGAVTALTRSIAKGYAEDGILAYAVAPGWVATERIAAKLAAPGGEKLLADVPMGAAAPPEEVANIVAFLLAGQATHATGATFDINGASYFH